MNIQEIRQKYPQYDDMSDEQLANGLHKKYYSDLPLEDFYNRIGLKAKTAEPPKTGPTVLPEGDTSSDFMRGIKNYLPQLQELGGAAQALTGVAATKLGAEETGKSLTESGLKTMEAGQAKAVVKESDEFLKAWEKGIGTVVTDWLPYQMGSGVANIAETLAAMGIGAGVGAVTGAGVGALPGAIAGGLSKTLVKKGVKEAAEEIAKTKGKDAAEAYVEKEAKKVLIGAGATAGMVGQAGVHGTGEVGGRAFEEERRRAEAAGEEFKPESIDMGRVAPAVVVHSIADYFFNKIGIDAMKIGEQATKSLALDIGKRIAVTGAKEIPAEELQTLAERYGAGLSLTDKEALNEYINTAAAAVGMSVVPGTVGGARTNFEGAQKRALDKLTEELKNKTQEKTEEVKQSEQAAPPATRDLTIKEEGAPDVAGSVTSTSGTSTGVAEQPDTVITTAGATTTESSGMGDTGAPATDVSAGTPNQPATLATMQPGQQVTLYRGENAENTKDGEWWTTDKAKAEKYGKVTEITLPAEVIGQHAAQGHGGPNEFVFPTKTPAQLAAEETRPYSEWNHPKKVEIPPVVYTKAEFPDVFPGYKYDPSKSEAENMQAAMQLQTEVDQKQEEDIKQALLDVRTRALKEQLESDKRAAEGKRQKITEFQVSPAKQAEYERTRQKLAEEGTTIPAWKDLSQLQKKVYFDFVKATTYSGTEAAEREHDIAGRELASFMEEAGRGRGYKQEKPTDKQQEVTFTYNRSRGAYNKLYGVSFPEWNTLSKKAKDIYEKYIGNNTPVEQDIAAAHLGLHLAEIGGKMTAEQKKKAEDNIAELKRRAQGIEPDTGPSTYPTPFASRRPRTEEEERQIDERAEQIYKEQEEQKALPVEVLKHIKDGNLQGILQYLRTKAKNAVHKALAQKLFALKLNTKIELVNSLPNNELAVYDPKRDVIIVTPEGLSDLIVLHEVVHAATVEILHRYETNPKSLTEEQRDAVEHLQEIMEISKQELGEDYPDAFKDIYEFVSYAMTDSLFQNELSRMKTKDLITTLLPDNKSMWSEFVMNMTKFFDFFKKLFTKEGDVKSENLLPEVFAAFEAIATVPKGGIEMVPLPATKPTTKKEAPPETVTSLDDRTSESNELYKLKSDQKPGTPFKALVKSASTTAGWQRMATIFQSESYPVRVLEQQLAKANLLFRTGKDAINNLHEQISLAASLARNYHNRYLKAHIEELNSSVAAYAKSAGITSEEALIDLHKVLEALHEPERRLVKYILSVPLDNTKKNLTFNGKQLSAADLRVEIIKVLNSGTTTEDEARQLRAQLDNIIFQKDAQGNIVYKDGYPQPNLKYVDPAGFSPSGTKSINVGDIDFKVTALDQASVNKITEQYNNSKYKEEMDRVRVAVQAVHEATKALNKIGNYWSQPVSNRVAFYGWNDYIPLKGLANHTKIDEQLDFDSRAMGRELQDNTGSMDGRFSVSRNPILQTMSDGVRSALRAGRRDLTQTIKNLLPESKLNPNGQGHLMGKVALHIPFEERDSVDLSEYKGETTIFHYNDDGSIDILVVAEPKMRNAIRRSYKRINPLIELANKITGGFGMLHTRYNYQFAPLNFVRDALTNAFTIGAEMGPREAARFLTAVATQVSVKNGFYKAMQIAALYDKGDEKSRKTLEALKNRDEYTRNMIEMIEQGGLVSYLQGLGLKSNFIELHKSIGKSGVITKLEDFNKFVDTWTDMFEIASRGAAYGIVKQNFYTKNLAKNMSEKDAMQAAMVEAAAYTKNLANFEQVGEMGKALGAVYMFFRPSATGAVRAIEALAPAWPGSLERAIFNLPKSIKDDQAAVDAFTENYKIQQRNARVMTSALFGMGMMAYAMAYMTADDDDLGRNAVATDNMDQWTRYLRFHIPRDITQAMGIKEPVVFQIPWGFGLGAFASAGAQIAAMTAGHTPMTKALSNIFTSITLDSFIPIPISKMPATEMPLEFLLDSIAPSVARPLLEFALNKNGMGQAIYNDQNRRMGDAYTGGDKIPELYKDVSASLARAFTGSVDVSPNTLYFLSNSYIDGLGRLLETAYGMPDIVKGEKSFNPKTDLPLMGSFFGAKSNVDSREFTAVENKIKDMERKIKMFDKADPETAFKYDLAHPFDRMLVDSYNAQLNAQLNPLREEAKKIRLMRGVTPDTKTAMLKMVTFQENLVKRNMIEQYKAFGVTP